jgi:hypothetical protein
VRFWDYLEKGIRTIERDMTPEVIARFEYAADYVLAFHGMPGWTSMKHRQGASGPATPCFGTA